MKILILSFYYTPDLCAGSFRTAALVRSLLSELPVQAQLEVITTLPNRYSSYLSEAPEIEKHTRLTIWRIKLPRHKSGMLDQARAFAVFAYQALKILRGRNYGLVYGTSSRLMTAVLSAFVARKKCLPLYLDIRDIFVDTIKDVLKKKVSLIVSPFFSILEYWAFTRAGKINLVSRGFKGYFESRYPEQRYSYFTNGIDREFLEAGDNIAPETSKQHMLTVLYAGNMGEGQGLHAVIPELAKRFEGRVVFRLIGDGGAKVLLQQRLQELECGNVELLAPIKREQLIQEYKMADILFLHLNDHEAFRKVLPSKLFEYGAVGKPVWAGIAGYAADFVKSEIENSAVFSPCDVLEAERVFATLRLKSIRRDEFIEKYSRENIMSNMAIDVLALLRGTK